MTHRPSGRGWVRPLLAGALALALLPSCAGSSGTAAGADPPVPERRSPGALISAALGAADSADHAAAAKLLREVRDRCGATPAGGRATLLLAAVHLDPRHAEGDPQTAAEASAEYLRAGMGPAWTGPVARALYLQALENGAAAPDPAGLGAGGDRSPPDRSVPEGCRETGVPRPLASSGALPELPGTPMVERLETLKARIAELEKELERIRDVLDEP